MLTFDSLRISGFRSFSSPQSITLERTPGLYLLSGENQVDKDLGSNGSGKSTVWEALCWVLYGKSSRSLLSTALHSWYESAAPCEVDVSFTCQGHSYHLLRTHKPNFLGWSIDKGQFTEATQEQLDSVLGVTIEPFLHSILISQFHPLFFDLGPSDKIHLLSSVLDLDRWMNYSSQAKEVSSKSKASIGAIQESVTRRESLAEGERRRIAEVEEKRRIWQDAREQNIRDLQNEVHEHAQAVEALKKDEGIAYTKVTAKETKMATLIEQRDDLQKEKDNLLTDSGEYRTAVKEMVKAEVSIESLKKRRKELLELKGTCGRCGQAIDSDTCADQASVIQGTILARVSDLDDWEEKKKTYEQKLELIEEHLTQRRRDFEAVEKELHGFRQGYSAVLSSLSSERTAIGMKEKHLEEYQSESNVFDESLEDARKALSTTQDNLDEEKMDLKHATQSAESYGYWVDGFRSIRVQLLEDSVRQFEASLQAAMTSCGLGEWAVRCSVDPESVGRSARKGFQILLSSSAVQDARPIPWEAWSGGEGQLLRLCGTLALSDLVADRCGTQANIEVYDEPSKSVSEEGVDNLLARLAERAQRQNKAIYVSDHRAMDSRHFAGVITATKKEEGTILSG